MKFLITSQAIDKLETDCLIVFVTQRDKVGMLTSFGQVVDKMCQGSISNLINKGLIDAHKGQIDMLYALDGVDCESVMLVGLGDGPLLEINKTRKLFSSVISNLDKRNIKDAAFGLLNIAEAMGQDDFATQSRLAQWLAEACHSSQYRYTETKGKAEKHASLEEGDKHNNNETDISSLKSVSLIIEKESHQGTIERHVAIGQAIGKGTTLCKNLANMPGNICTPTYLAKTAQSIGKQYGITTTIFDEAKLKKLGMGALLSVSKGSREPAKFITMEYLGATRKQAPIVLIGKGLTFDAGGISLKPATTMDEMKYDMCGGSSVLGVMLALGELAVPINVIGVVPSSENLPDGAANKPGDVVTSMKGLTIEVINTDAEGRLLLCDALTYIDKFKPAMVVDIATLTGACVVALGQHANGLFSNDDKLANALVSAGDAAGDRAWRMPIWDEYDEQLKSNFADISNSGGRTAGAVTAACFLKRFAETYRWAHLDIAGTAWKSGKNKGATGRPVAMLMQFLLESIDS